MPEKSRLMPISYYNPKQEIRLSAYADTIVLEPDGREQHLRAIRFGGYPEMVRAMSDAIYAGATLETEFAGEPAMLACEPKKYECHLSHDGIYAEATILSLDDADTAAKKDEDAQADGQTNVELPPRKCVLFCPAGDRRALFEALDRKTAVPLIPEFQDYVLDELRRRRWLKPLRVISIRERLEAWLLLCKKDDANIVKVLEDGLKTGAIRIPGAVQNPNGFESVHSVTSYLYAFGVTVAERIRNQFQPLFDPAAEQLSPEILRINDYIRAHAGYSLYPNSRFNGVVEMTIYPERWRVEGEAFRAWGEIDYAQQLLPCEVADYELRPSRHNPDIRREMDAQAQIVGAWEDAKRVPEQKRLTWFYPDFGSYVSKEHITPEQLAAAARGVERQQASRAYKEGKRTISQQMQDAAKQAEADRGQSAPKKNAPDRGER